MMPSMSVLKAKAASAAAAIAATLFALQAFSAVYPSENLHGPALQLRQWIEFALALLAVGAGSTCVGRRLRIRRPGLAAVAGLMVTAAILWRVRTAEAELPLMVLLALLPVSIAAAMFVIARRADPGQA
jgi:hypothetical protein